MQLGVLSFQERVIHDPFHNESSKAMTRQNGVNSRLVELDLHVCSKSLSDRNSKKGRGLFFGKKTLRDERFANDSE